jgi:putative molybdopterin biosynthesis protein
MGAVLDQMLVMQGSDDWLLSQVMERYLGTGELPVVSASVGSLAGLEAVASGTAHVAGCHVANEQVRKVACRDRECYLLNLFDRHQGLIHDPEAHPGITGLESVVERKMRFAIRQPLSGTHRLVVRLFEERGLSMDGLEQVGPFSEHVALAMAIRMGRADAGVGIRVAAEQCGLGFIPLHTEAYKLAIPPEFFSSPRIAHFTEFMLEEIRTEASKEVPGYAFDNLGVIETIRAPGGA